MQKKISAGAMQALKEALTHIYWYKPDLRSFLSHCLSERSLLSQLNWSEYKRNIVANLIDHLARQEHIYQDDLLQLIFEVSNITDFTHLENLEDGKIKAQKAEAAVAALRNQLKGHQNIVDERNKIKERRKQANERLASVNEVQNQIASLKEDFYGLFSCSNVQQRGYDLEKFLTNLFDLFDLDPRAAFRITGEQIDGSFSFEGTDYLVEAKWVNNPVGAKDLDSLAGKLSRKLDNTLGLFVSISGFSKDAISTHSSGRRLVLLLDGSDLIAILDNRIKLDELIRRKRRNAAETGNIYVRIDEILKKM